MNPETEPTEKKQPPILYGVLAVGAFLAIIATGWMVLSPSALLHRQFASASSTPVQPAAPAPEVERLVRGRVLDAESGAPLRGASVWAGKEEIRTDEDGRFTTPPLGPGAAILVKSPGYELRRLVADKDEMTVALPSRAVRAAYLTYFGVADKTIRERVLELVARTELNAVVIDVKGDRGPHPLSNPGAAGPRGGRAGAGDHQGLRGHSSRASRRGESTPSPGSSPSRTLSLPRPSLSWAIIDTRTGKPWIDNEKLAWVDPFREEVRDYNIAIAKEAVAKGFDEVQFDYVRFPTDGKLVGRAATRSPTTRTPGCPPSPPSSRRPGASWGPWVPS